MAQKVKVFRKGSPLEPTEVLGLQGFSSSILKPCDPPLTFSNYVDLAGNAFNGAVVTAVLLAIFTSADWKRLQELSSHFKSGAGMDLSDDEECGAECEEGEEEDREFFEPGPVVEPDDGDVGLSD